jgi:hypothetical protein
MKRNLCIISLLLGTSLGLLSFSHITGVKDKFLQLLEEKLEAYNKKLPQEKIYLHTDKPFYKPGEAIWFNALLSTAQTIHPPPQ